MTKFDFLVTHFFQLEFCGFLHFGCDAVGAEIAEASEGSMIQIGRRKLAVSFA